MVNELFEPREQVDESQHSLLAIALQTAAGGIPTPHVGTGSGGSSSDLPWKITTKINKKGRNPKVEGDNYLQIMNLPFPLSLPQRTDEIVLSTMVGMMSTFSRKNVAELTVKAARVSKPGSVSTELKLSSEKEKSISMPNF